MPHTKFNQQHMLAYILISAQYVDQKENTQINSPIYNAKYCPSFASHHQAPKPQSEMHKVKQYYHHKQISINISKDTWHKKKLSIHVKNECNLLHKIFQNTLSDKHFDKPITSALWNHSSTVRNRSVHNTNNSNLEDSKSISHNKIVAPQLPASKLSPTKKIEKQSHSRMSSKDSVKTRFSNIITLTTKLGSTSSYYSTIQIMPSTTKSSATSECTQITLSIRNHFKQSKSFPSYIGLYKIGKTIGKGAFGKVRLGMHKLTGKLVAVKSLKKESMDPSNIKKVYKEIQILKQFKHPNIMTLYETFDTDTHILLVTELCTGGDLLTYVRKRRKLSEDVAKVMLKQILDGLYYIHSKGILHRDIKLDNILINLNGNIKICDFGVSKYIINNKIMTKQCGTPAYIAPEILKGDGYQNYTADIWSTGGITFTSCAVYDADGCSAI